MKRFAYILAVLVAACGALSAQEAGTQWGGVGVGAIIGEPTGATAKLWMTDRTAMDIALAWSFGQEEALAQADYVIHRYGAFNIREGELPYYYGLGVQARFTSDTVGIRIPVGLDYMFDDRPYEVFIEVAPVIDIVGDDKEFLVNAAFGVRYYYR